MSDSFDRAWSDLQKSPFRRGREQRRREMYARMPEMARRYRAFQSQNQPPPTPEPPARRRPVRRRSNAVGRIPAAMRGDERTFQGPSNRDAADEAFRTLGFDSPVRAAEGTTERTPDRDLGTRMTDPDADPNASGYMDAPEDERMEAVESLSQQFNQAKEGMDDARSRFDAALEDGRLTEDEHAKLTSTYEDQYATLAPRHVLQPKETEERPPDAVQGEREDPIFREAFGSLFDEEEPQPEQPQPQPPIETPASDVIEPTPKVQEKVNQPRPLGDDMSSLRPNTDLYDRFSNEAIRGQIPENARQYRDEAEIEYMRTKTPPLPSKGKITMNGKPVELDENGEFRSEDGSVSITNNDSVISDGKKDEAESMFRTVQNEKAKREGRDLPFPDHKPTTEAEGKFSDVQTAKRARMAPKTDGGGQDVKPSDEKPTGGKMSMKDLVNNSKASKNAKAKDAKKIPMIHGSTSPDTVREIMDMAEDGNQEAMSMLYGATADLEDESHPANHLHEEVLELVEGYDPKAAAKAKRAERRKKQSKSRKEEQGKDPSRKDISAPLTEATGGEDNEAIARRLLGNRD